MAKKDSENQKKSMSRMFRGRAIFKPLNTGRIDEHVACVREWVANIFFYKLAENPWKSWRQISGPEAGR